MSIYFAFSLDLHYLLLQVPLRGGCSRRRMSVFAKNKSRHIFFIASRLRIFV